MVVGIMLIFDHGVFLPILSGFCMANYEHKVVNNYPDFQQIFSNLT
tara:strand:+ start:461 stop:598 length:138 start_codon:yes stop_codon:yes gene_type:complete